MKFNYRERGGDENDDGSYTGGLCGLWTLEDGSFFSVYVILILSSHTQSFSYDGAPSLIEYKNIFFNFWKPLLEINCLLFSKNDLYRTGEEG